EALKFLLEIYQQEKDWMKAVGIALELEKDSGQSAQKEIANYYCELALVEATHSRPEGARHHLQAALAAHRKCVRANIILGDIAAASGDHDGAIEAWKRIEHQNPSYLALVAQRLLESHRAIGRAEEGLTLLRGYLASFPSLDLLDVAFQSTLDSEGPETAYKLVKDELRRHQTSHGLRRLGERRLFRRSRERGALPGSRRVEDPHARGGRNPDLRAGTARSGQAQPGRGTPALHDRRRARGALRNGAVHRGGDATRRGRFGRSPARDRRGTDDRPAHDRIPGDRGQVHRAGRHRGQGAHRSCGGAPQARRGHALRGSVEPRVPQGRGRGRGLYASRPYCGGCRRPQGDTDHAGALRSVPAQPRPLFPDGCTFG